MVQTLILAFALAVGFAALPLAWGLRAWVATGLPLLWAQTLAPITPWQNQGPFDGAGSLLLSWLFVFATLGVAAKAFWTLAQKPLDRASLTRGMEGPDSVLAILYGGVAGTILTLVLAAEFRGMTGGMSLHVAVAGVAAVAALGALRLPLRLRSLTVAALVTVAGLTMVGGLSYPSLILSKTEIILPGAPRCLRTPDGTPPTIDQMRLLTLPKAEGRRPNLVLTVMTQNGQRDFRWSYRSFGFRTYDSYAGGPCPSP